MNRATNDDQRIELPGNVLKVIVATTYNLYVRVRGPSLIRVPVLTTRTRILFLGAIIHLRYSMYCTSINTRNNALTTVMKIDSRLYLPYSYRYTVKYRL